MRIGLVAMVLIGCAGGSAAPPLDGGGGGGGGGSSDAGTVIDAGVGPPSGSLFEHQQTWTSDVSGLITSSESDEMINTLANTNGGWGGTYHRFQFDDSIHVLQRNRATHG